MDNKEIKSRIRYKKVVKFIFTEKPKKVEETRYTDNILNTNRTNLMIYILYILRLKEDKTLGSLAKYAETPRTFYYWTEGHLLNVERRNANDALPWQDIGFYLLPLGKRASIMQACDWLATGRLTPTQMRPHTDTYKLLQTHWDTAEDHMLRLRRYKHTKAHTHTQTPGGRAQILCIRHGGWLCACVCCNLQTKPTKTSRQVPQYIGTYYLSFISF